MEKVIEEIKKYISELSNKYKNGITTEHSFRGALEALLKNMTSCTVINEARHIDCGAPDLTLLRKDIPIGFVEAKDIGKNLNSKDYKNQFDRYRKALDNLIITDYVLFQFFEGENLIAEIAIGKILPNKIEPIPENFNAFVEMIKSFSLYNGKAIKSSRELAEFMAAKTQLLQEAIEKTIADKGESNSLCQQLEGFKQVLLPTMTETEFADIYAQTIAYGMFVAQLQDFSDAPFTRQHAATLIPQSNPFLRNFLQYIAGFDLDKNIQWIVNSLADMFNYVDITAVRKEFISKDKDPFLHFYEDFLTKYNKNLKTAMGAYYTPLAVVKFIVKAVDDILKTDFNIPDGLADSSPNSNSFPNHPALSGTPPKDGNCHRVQILDPATGTGTFLAEIVRTIYSQFENNAGMWSDYVKNHLIPRLNGFEIMMAPYTMAHLKMEMILQETKYVSRQDDTNSSRLHIYLTNALEGSNPNKPQFSFVKWLSDEAKEATKIKDNAPVMVVLGNPPYSVSSQNKGKWINDLLNDYKQGLNEKNIQPLSDDYIKFIRYGQYFIEKNGEGILAYISNNSFIDGLIHREMRKNLLETFDKIYILDLHGNSKKKEVCPDGSKDENVFDIQQGVSINIFVKTRNKQNVARVFHCDLYGKRQAKYNFLLDKNMQITEWKELQPQQPNYFFVPKDFSLQAEYEKGFKTDEFFIQYSSGIKTHDDANLVDFLPFSENNQLYNYRPFDIRNINYDLKKVKRHRNEVMKHFINGENVGLVIARQAITDNWSHVQVSNTIIDNRIHYSNKGIPVLMPLYLYPETEKLFAGETRKPNLNKAIIEEISQRIGLRFVETIPASPKEESNHPLPPPKEGNYGGDRNSSPKNSPPLEGCPIGRGGCFPHTDWCPTRRGGSAESGNQPKAVACGGRNSQNYMALPFNPKLKDRARELRKAGNLSEVLFWNRVKNKQFKNFDFDRQKIIGNYIVDFYCTNCNVVIEIDGSSHDDKQEYDAIRDDYLKSLGLEVIHITDIDIKKNITEVMEMLYNHPALSETPPKKEGNNHPLPPTKEKSNHPLPPPEEGNYGGDRNSSPKNSPPLEGCPIGRGGSFPPMEGCPIGRGGSFPHTEGVGGGRLSQGWFAPIDVLDYIYAVLHSPAYRKRYKEFLKIDFPRVPYPENAEQFWSFVELGGKLRRLHLLEGVEPQQGVADFPVAGTDEVEKPEYSLPLEGQGKSKDAGRGRVYINDKQYFDQVPLKAWNFYIGGYQPAQKWLKDRKGRKLGYDDIRHYQRVIRALKETGDVMEAVDVRLN